MADKTRKTTEFLIFAPKRGFILRQDRTAARSTQNALSAKGLSSKSFPVLRRDENVNDSERRKAIMPNGIRVRF